MKIKELLESGIEELNKNNIEESTLKTKILLAFLLKENKEYLIINSEKEIEENIINSFFEYIDLLIKGKPIQYITNKQEFMGLDFFVDENVLIPQPDTEILLETSLQCLKNFFSKDVVKDVLVSSKKINILDLCTGSGAIAVSLAKYISEDIQITATDISDKALTIAKKNARKHNATNRINFVKSNMFENIKEQFDIIISNPPYIETDEIKNLSDEVKNEPLIALDGGKDGLDFYRIIAENAYKHLNKDGVVLLEIGYNQKKKVINLLEKVGYYKNIECIKDLSRNDRVIKGEKNVIFI